MFTMASTAFHLGFWLTNLFVPGDPQTFTVNSPHRAWDFHQHPNYERAKAAVLTNGMTGETYAAENSGTVGNSRSASMDAAFDELIPLCLGASYLTGMSVAPASSTMMSEIKFVTVGDHFPRSRSMGTGFAAATTQSDFIALMEKFLAGWFSFGATEKVRLLVHHWLDALAFWSLEDLTLSTTTILEIIAATSKAIAALQGTNLANFNDRIAFAASRFNLPTFPRDFRDMRNDLVHEGTLSGTRFPSKDINDCAAAAAAALTWIDSYIFAALRLGAPAQSRFSHAFAGINSFSL
jgi:hypothetical protein